jgi:hypothetical protein
MLASTWDENNYVHFPLVTFNSFCWRVDIVLTKDRIYTLTDVVIANTMHVDLIFWSCTTKGFAASNAAQAKKKSYRDWHPIDQMLILAIEVFECLHKQIDVFLHNYANVIWSLK